MLSEKEAVGAIHSCRQSSECNLGIVDSHLRGPEEGDEGFKKIVSRTVIEARSKIERERERESEID